MKNHKLAGSICALLLTALGASTAAAQTSTASILVTRPIYRFDGAHGSQLYRVQPSGQNLTTLVPVTYGVDIQNPGWSPGGSSVVFEAFAREANDSYSGWQLYAVNRQGGSPRQLTTGNGEHSHPLWGPNGIIAFVNGACLGAVRADGTQQHIVFCPPHESGQRTSYPLHLFQWTASGNGVLIEASGDEGGLEPELLFSTVYRVNVSTGFATKLAAQVFESGGGDLTIAPDGQHGVYGGSPMLALDFASNSVTPLPAGGANPTYSPDGSKIAFLHSNDPSNPDEHLRIYIMRADGSNVHPAPAQTTNPDVYIPSISTWSADGTRLLFNQVGNNQWVRMIDLRTKTSRNVTNGVAGQHAWFHP